MAPVRAGVAQASLPYGPLPGGVASAFRHWGTPIMFLFSLALTVRIHVQPRHSAGTRALRCGSQLRRRPAASDSESGWAQMR